MTESFDTDALHPALRALRDCFTPVDEELAENEITFWDGELDNATFVHATVDVGSDLVRVRVYLPSDEGEAVAAWVEAQPEAESGVLQHSEIDGLWTPRLVFQRNASIRDWNRDPMFAEIDAFGRAWWDDAPVPLRSQEAAPFEAVADPRDRAPQNAWILMGSEPSYFEDWQLEQLRNEDARGIFSTVWTAPSQIAPGDLVLIYFTAPRKTVSFVARAASRAFFSTELDVNAERAVARAQWWSHLTCPIEIDPIHLQQLRGAYGEGLILRGRSGHYVRPDVIQGLPWIAADPEHQEELDRVVEIPAGASNRPVWPNFDLDTWRDFAAGLIVRERQVTDWLLVPLLKHLLPSDCNLHEEHPLPRGIGTADLVIQRDGQVRHVIEVKQRIRRARNSDWDGSPDFRQMRRYASHLEVPGTLFDAQEVIGFDVQGHGVLRLDRLTTSTSDLDRLRRHLLGASAR